MGFDFASSDTTLPSVRLNLFFASRFTRLYLVRVLTNTFLFASFLSRRNVFLAVLNSRFAILQSLLNHSYCLKFFDVRFVSARKFIEPNTCSLFSFIKLVNEFTTVQLGYCDSDVTVCLLFRNMPIIQNRDVKYLYKRYRYYLQAFKAKSNCVPVVT